MTEAQVAWGSVVGLRLEQSDGRDWSYILQAMEKQWVFSKQARIDFRKERMCGDGAGCPPWGFVWPCVRSCHPPLLQTTVQTMARQVLPNEQEKATNE